ncbi:unnamed protein product [Rhizopus stolonifer]
MNKLKNVFQRSQKVIEERRPQQFIKRLSSANPSTSVGNSPESNAPPTINLSDLSEMERRTYQSWWKDLDPFGHGKIDNQTILVLFELAGDELNQIQFFAMLRLIAHAQNGRKVSKALVYLGAPVPHFRTNAIDALIKPSVPRIDTEKTPERASWWGTEVQASSNNRRSYIGPFTANNPVPNTIFQSDTQQNQFYPTNNNQYSAPSVPPLLSQSTRKSEYTHSRSKSAGNAISYTQPLGMEDQLQPSRSSLSLHELAMQGNHCYLHRNSSINPLLQGNKNCRNQ